jgi:alpha-tubulin suppressor-like RCC1 family protein
MKRRVIKIGVTIILATHFIPSTNDAATRTRSLAETILNDSLVRLAAGSAHTCQVNDDGTVRCWGLNSSGQLGDGTTTTRPTPVTVVGLTNAVAIAAGEFHTCVLVANGTARCWGDNSKGQLGDGTTTTRLTAVSVPNVADAVAIAAGEFHTCAILANGTARCWGDNISGQLGDGTTTQRLTPTAVTISFLQRSPSGGTVVVVPLGNIVQIATGRRHTCAIIANGFGSVRCWGENGSGQIGVGATSDVLRPLSVPSFTLNIDPLVHLQSNTRVATVQIIAACEVGQQLHVNVTLTQGAESGRGVGVGECSGGVERFPVTVAAQGRSPFVDGPAVVNAEALNRELGLVVDTQEWTRKVQFVIAP